MELNVILGPGQRIDAAAAVWVVVDELRASSMLTTALGEGCSEVVVTASLRRARQLAREDGSLLAGDRDGRRPSGFGLNNSPVQLVAAGPRGRRLVLSTTNGTAVLSRLQRLPVVLVGCLLNASACAEAAFSEAISRDTGIGILCAGERGRFALEDAVAGGRIAERILELAAARGAGCRLSDGTRAALRLAAAYPVPGDALWGSSTGDLLVSLSAQADIEFCAQVDVSATVPVLRGGNPLRVVPWGPTSPDQHAMPAGRTGRAG